MADKTAYEEIELRIKELEKYMAYQRFPQAIDTSRMRAEDTAAEITEKDSEEI